jgi:uncharacterized protein YydD (DUF2326 family)
MLYSEFLTGTEAPDNEYTYSEYERINAIYNNNNSLTKGDAYRMYQEPPQLIKNLIESRNTYKADMIAARAENRATHDELNAKLHELGQARAEILKLEAEINRYRNAAHALYYATGTI